MTHEPNQWVYFGRYDQDGFEGLAYRQVTNLGGRSYPATVLTIVDHTGANVKLASWFM